MIKNRTNGDGINKKTREKSHEMRFDVMRGRKIRFDVIIKGSKIK